MKYFSHIVQYACFAIKPSYISQQNSGVNFDLCTASQLFSVQTLNKKLRVSNLVVLNPKIR